MNAALWSWSWIHYIIYYITVSVDALGAPISAAPLRIFHFLALHHSVLDYKQQAGQKDTHKQKGHFTAASFALEADLSTS